MCKNLLVLVCVLSVAGVSLASVPTTWTEVGYWDFDNAGNLAANGYGVAGYVTGGAYDAGGISGGAMDCSNGGVAIPQQAWTTNIASQKIMYDFWVKGNSTLGFGDKENIVFQWEATGQAAYLAALGDLHGGIDGVILLQGDNYYQRIEAGNAPGDTRFNQLIDQWAHVQMVYDYGNFEIYINDALFLAMPGASHTGMYGGPYVGMPGTVVYGEIGCRTWPSSGPDAQGVQGLIDEFRIFTPEPMTIALLGLGGLFLRRRKTA